ncbi:MAG: hypothetical protein AAB875_00405, partial [Patescibacteria group bacterium]
VAEVKGIKGDPQSALEAVVIESSKDRRGAFASVVVREGTLKVGQLIQAEGMACKIRALFNFKGESVKEILPGEAGQILGFAEIPPVGARVTEGGVGEVTKKEEGKKVGKLKEGEIAVFLKAESLGSLEALLGSVPPGIMVVGAAAGEVNESDVLNAKSLNARIFAFESKVPTSVAKLAETEGVKIEKYEVIYELLEKLGELLKKGQAEVLGKAEILAEFPFNNKRVAGCKITEGKIVKGDSLILKRSEKEVGKAKALSMKKQKNEITEAKTGEEFGVVLEPQLDFKIGDMLVSVRK